MLGLLCAAAARADERAISVWYRSGDGCPEGAAFLAEVETRGAHARLAQVGDPIDFVVTLGLDDAHHGRGVLERATSSGKVALSSVQDASCAQVASALALTLVLAASQPTEEPAATVVETPEPDAPAPSAPAPQPSPRPHSAVLAIDRERAPAHASGVSASGPRYAVGAHAWMASGVVPGVLAGGLLVLEVELGAHGLVQPMLRVGALLGTGEGTPDRAGAQVIEARLISGRLEGCPIKAGEGLLSLRPCLAFDIGHLRSEHASTSGRADGGLWAALELTGALRVRILEVLSIEAQAGAAVPITRYVLAQDGPTSSALYRTAALMAIVRIGAIVHFP